MINRAKFQSLVRRILNEELEKTSAVGNPILNRVPEMNANGVDPEKKNKTFSTDPNTRDKDSKEAAEEELRKAVNSIDKSYTVVWNDHDDLMVNGRDRGFICITPLWEDTYKIIFMTRNEDRVFVTGLSWKQVIEFVKDNLDKPNYTGVEKARDRSWRNQEAQPQPSDKGLPQDDKPKTMSTDKPFTKEKNKDKRYVEDQVKDEKDLPNMPMREPGDQKTQADHKVKDPVKLRKRTPDKKLVIKQK